jgi:hypothetical protein
MTRRFYSSTAQRTTLASDVTAVATTMVVNAATSFPAVPWRAIVDADTVNEEVITVTNRSGTTLTIVRGVDGTAGTSHLAGASFRHGVSAADFDEPNAHVNSDAVHIGVYTSGTRPGSPTTGQHIYESDTGNTMKWNGSAWVAVKPNASYQTTAPTGPSVGDIWVDSDASANIINALDYYTKTQADANYWPLTNQVTGRNLVHNGAMQVAQRGTSTASITTSGYYTADRWLDDPSGTSGTWTQSVAADGPTSSGFTKSLKMLCTTANASLAVGAYHIVQQNLEGQDVQRVAKGTASAKTLTLSFWVKSNVTGTYVCQLEDTDNTRHVSASYTVSASATWEYKTITFPADATGALNNGASLSVEFWLGAGTNFTSGTLATAWAATTSANRAVGQTNVAAAINNYWQVTGIQLETGSVATPFEFRSFGDDLRTCQRYYYRYTNSGAVDNYYGGGTCTSTTNVRALIPLPVTMRVVPTALDVSSAGHFYLYDGSVTPTANSVVLGSPMSPNTVQVNAATASATLTVGRFGNVISATSGAYLGFTADL